MKRLLLTLVLFIIPFTALYSQTDSTTVEPLSAAASSRHSWYLKTNLAAWTLLIQNISVEADVSDRLSVALPIYYSGLNYFTRTVKFRTIAFQPELRYWLRQDSDNGLFLAIHGGVAWYNLAVNGSIRFQDHNGNTPALGGGVNVGYRCDITQSGRWRLELDAGLGAYSLNYDKYANVTNGALVQAARKKTYIGLDRLSVSIIYTINLNRKGAER